MSESFGNVQIYCPNCGQRNYGYKNAKGLVLFKCRKCGCCLSSKRMKEQKVIITVSQQN
jgi:uncharacterized Zn finger protein